MQQEFIERLGAALREKWVEIKKAEQEQGKNVPADHLLLWEELDDRNKDIDCQLALAVLQKYIQTVLPVLVQILPTPEQNLDALFGASAQGNYGPGDTLKFTEHGEEWTGTVVHVSQPSTTVMGRRMPLSYQVDCNDGIPHVVYSSQILQS